MFQTMGGNPRNFNKLDLYSLPSPCFVIDKKALQDNLEILYELKEDTNVKILLALKAFSTFSLAPLISNYLDGCCSSGLYETRLAKKYFKGEISTFSPAYKTDEFNEIAQKSNHIIFNSLNQMNDFYDVAKKFNNEIGIRINPLYSEVVNEKYSAASLNSRLGIHLEDLKYIDYKKLSGIHFHTLCEQNFKPLENTWNHIRKTIIPLSKELKWINLGGGHHITRKDYQINKLKKFLKEIAITDISATSHIPDVIEAPYRPALLNEPKTGHRVQLGGPSCLAGDNIGVYNFNLPPKIGQRIALLDQAHYTMVKTNFFNGVRMPSIAIWDSRTDELNIIKEFSYDDFENKLS